MRRIEVAHGGRVVVAEVAEPVPASDEVLVELRAAGICGSDLHAVAGRHPFIELPYAPGHEAVGVVLSAGDGVADAPLGARVVVEPPLPCGECRPCRTGSPNVCENLAFFGCGWPQGAMAERFTVRADRVHVVPDGLGDAAAALVEPLSTPVHAARLVGRLAGKRVAILGAGTIGLLALAVARGQGAEGIAVTARRESSRARAASLGAPATVDATAPDAAERLVAALGGPADVVLDCVAEQSTLETAFGTVVNGGTIAVLGVPVAPVTVPLPDLQDRQLRLQGSATYTGEDVASAIRMLDAGLVDVSAIASACFALAEAPEAFRAAAAGDHVKVLLTP